MELGREEGALSGETLLGPRTGTVLAALAGMIGMAASASAETWTVIPTLSVGAIYDDNLFFDDARLEAAGLRAGPALSLEYQPTVRLKLLGRAGLDSEYFGDPSASNWDARRSAGLTARYRLGSHTTVSLSGDYALTAYAAELLPSAGVDFGRRRAESLGGKVELEHRLSSRVLLRVGSGIEAFQLERSGLGLRSQIGSDAALLLQVAPHTTLSVQTGPRYLAGSLSPHVAGSLERTRTRTRLSLGYERGRSLVFDRTLVVEGYSVRLSYRLSRALTVSASPALFRQWERATEQRSWHADGIAAYRARSWLTAFVNYSYVVQDRGFYVNPLTRLQGAPQLWQNVLSAGFTLVPRHVREAPKQ